MFIISILIGTFITAFMVNALKKEVHEEVEDKLYNDDDLVIEIE
jgi:fructose-specific phosphotransferase system IIC component